MLSEGWAAWSGQTGDLAAVLRALEPREGLDEDEVACVYYALDGVARAGPRDATIWASQRAIDAAYARVPRSEGAATFRPLDEDTAMPVVQSEFRWQDRVLQILETNADLAEAGQQVRS
ncbi:hypothetical protein ASE12_15740 [Aeromicrobium sp. Root236]|nr:hypothetical protein ASE12_15740 [Aeromicrobium sp. Root236]